MDIKGITNIRFNLICYFFFLFLKLAFINWDYLLYCVLIGCFHNRFI